MLRKVDVREEEFVKACVRMPYSVTLKRSVQPVRLVFAKESQAFEACYLQSYLSRCRGLLGTGPREFRKMGLEVAIFPSCRSLHSCFMTRAFDLAFFSEEGYCLHSRRNIGPWRVISCPKASWAIERYAQPDAFWPDKGSVCSLYWSEEDRVFSRRKVKI